MMSKQQQPKASPPAFAIDSSHSIDRRRWMLALGAGAMSVSAASFRSAHAQENPASLYLADDVDRAVRSGIDFLVTAQREDGAIADRGHEVAMTALAIMAMASIGIEPIGVSDAGRAMQRGINFVLDRRNQDMEGYFGARDGSRMYGHGITTLMLTEILGMGASPEQNEKIHRRSETRSS